MTAFTYVWEFIVTPGRESAFRELYGQSGAWVRLFRTAGGYRETLLLQDPSRPGRFLTIDRWESEDAFRRFRRERAAEFEAIDRAGAGLTVTETELGEFVEVA